MSCEEEFAKTALEYQILYLSELVSEWESIEESSWTDSPAWGPITDYYTYYQLGLNLAFAAQLHMVSLKDSGIKEINDAWNGLMNLCNNGDGAYDHEDSKYVLNLIFEGIEANQ